MQNLEKLQILVAEGQKLVQVIDPKNGKPKHSDVRKLKRIFRRLGELIVNVE